MRISIDIVARTSIEMEVDEEQMAKIEESGWPTSLYEFESLTGLNVDPEGLLETAPFEVDDVNVLPEPKETKERTT